MPPAESAAPAVTLIDIHAFLTAQRGERYRSCVIHGAPLSGKTHFARQLAEQQNGVYLDVLERVAQSSDLSARVDELDVPWLASLAREASAAPLVVMDEFDFLFPVWGGDVAPFKRLVETLYLETPAIVLWILQSRPAFDTWVLARPDGTPRLLKLADIQQI